MLVRMPLMNKLIRFAMSPQGRKLTARAKAYAGSPKGKKQIEQARKQAQARGLGNIEFQVADAYSPRLPEGQTYPQRLLKELDGKIDLSRVHFTGKIPYADYVRLLQRSAVHVYLTYPFVLSWSMLEAMSAGCLVVGSRTPPVEEVIRDGENGLLVDFFSPAAIAEKVDQALAMDQGPLRSAARETVVQRYDLKRVCLPAQVRLVEALKSQRPDARPAADVQHLPGHKPRVTVGEEEHRPRDVVRAA